MKSDLADLAFFGGPAAFDRPLLVGRPNRIDRAKLYERLDRALDSGWLSNGGPLVQEFEQRVAELAGVRHAVATCNATVALQLLVHGAGLTGEVIMPSMTFAATAHAVSWLGLTPVFADIDPHTGTLDPERAAAAVTSRTSALLGVHLWGRPCAPDGLRKVADEHGLPLFFDAAHALGCAVDGRPAGSLGDAEVFSFHATKAVNAFEGGAVVTDDAEFAARVRALHNFGAGLSGAGPAGGTNAKMSEAAAAMGLTSLEAFPEVVVCNRRNHAAYRAELADLPGVRVADHDSHGINNHQYVVIEIDAETAGFHRDVLRDVLLAEHVHTRAYFSPACHQLEPYRRSRHAPLPHTEHMAERVLALPTGTSVGDDEIRRIGEVIRLCARQGPDLTARYRATPPSPAVATPTIGRTR
ncbi:dTDP-4-dehydro-6-deoxyglucose aminotransferase [Streptomyces sp. RY43-2]|uniref:dTDP-4-dehydro-6-deoxyglucose aminotransferase n=1 Tax=Streptomyces macrolidinus TaxID=2952607 RepID=A0ABT0ZLB2_9ACTN|nr:dTDP-4-dehydro-6-deoxyglucose aminotransferase [Streptomyces macrolidinus]MCN9244366.1 dTDP-4-dehydro-6-deoxyglucose aminotransferase [Streptomyces macrolidinus]